MLCDGALENLLEDHPEQDVVRVGIEKPLAGREACLGIEDEGEQLLGAPDSIRLPHGRLPELWGQLVSLHPCLVPQELLDREGALTGEAVVPVRILEERSHGRIEAEPTLEHEAQGGRRDVALAHASREQEVIGRHLPALLPRGEAGRSLDHPPVGQHECRGGSGQPSLADQLLQPPPESCTQSIGIG